MHKKNFFDDWYEEEEEDDDESGQDCDGWEFHRAGEKVCFQAQFPCTLFGVKYRKWEEVEICLWEDWCEEDGFGEGGPWGWGGFTSWTLRRLAGYSWFRIVD